MFLHRTHVRDHGIESEAAYLVRDKGAAREGGAEGAQAPRLSNQNIDVYFLSYPQHCKSRSGGIAECSSAVPQGVATRLLSNQAVMNFRGLRDIEAAFFVPA